MRFFQTIIFALLCFVLCSGTLQAQDKMNNKKIEKALKKVTQEIEDFHSALDAKYSLYEGFVIGIYTHPLQELDEKQMVNAMQQVVNLSKNFGTSYTSTDVMFGHSAQNATPKKLKKS